MLRVALGEDSYLAREGISRVLEAEDDIEIVATCEDFESLRAAVGETEPDVVLTDIRMPPTHTDEGIRLAAELRATHPAVGVVVLSQYAEPLYATKLLESGSGGRAYLLKERVTDRGELSRALREVAEGRSVVDAQIVEALLEVRRRREESGLDTLTSREQEILALIAQGAPNKVIAHKLQIAEKTVKNHVSRIFQTLDVTDRTQAALWAARNGLDGSR